MAVTATPALFQKLRISPITIVNADASTVKTVFTPGANGSRVYAMGATNTDITARVVAISLTRSATNYLLTTINVPAASGTDGTNSTINLMKLDMWPSLSVDSEGNRYINLESGDTLSVNTTSTVGVGKTFTVTAMGADL